MSHVTEKNRYHKKSCLSVFLYNTGCLLPQRIKRLSYSSRHIVVVVIFFLVAQTMTFSFLRWLLQSTVFYHLTKMRLFKTSQSHCFYKKLTSHRVSIVCCILWCFFNSLIAKRSNLFVYILC